jgi:hypothetical protein
MIPQGRNPGWTIQKLQAIQKARLKIVAIGQLMYDNPQGNTVNTAYQRMTFWEIHPVMSFWVCPTGDCTVPVTSGKWVKLEDYTPAPVEVYPGEDAGKSRPGVERWSIKTSVPEGSKWEGARNVSLPELLALPEPRGVTRNDRRYQNARIPEFPNALKVKEGDLIAVEGWLQLVALEADGDYHVQISNRAEDGNNCLVVEIPSPLPAFTSSESLRPLFAKTRRLVRDSLLGGLTPVPAGTVVPQPVYVQVMGALFYDDSDLGGPPRGKKGMKAGTAWEIHPVVDIRFAPTRTGK